MKILHVYKDYYPVVGGIENHVRLLAEAQAAAGHEVAVLVASRTAHTVREQLNGVQVIKAARLATIASTPLSLALPAILARQRPDIAHMHFPYPLGELAQGLLGRSRATVVTYHSDVVRQVAWLRLYRPWMLRVLRAADRIIATTPNYVESSEVLRGLRDRCTVVPFGVDAARLVAPPEEVAALRQRHGGGPLVLFVGVLRYYKGLHYLLEAMQQVEARLLVVGSGPMESALRAQAQALGLGERVCFVGRVADEELGAWYRAADLFVLPASERSEAFGLVQLEAMSCGLPVVCTELGTGTSYVNRHGESGLVVPPKEPQALAEALNRLLADDALRQRLAAGALARSRAFTVEHMVAAIEQVYRQVLSQHQKPARG